MLNEFFALPMYMTHNPALCPAPFHLSRNITYPDFIYAHRIAILFEQVLHFSMHAKIKKTYTHKIIKRRDLQKGPRRWFKPHQNKLYLQHFDDDLFEPLYHSTKILQIKYRYQLYGYVWNRFRSNIELNDYVCLLSYNYIVWAKNISWFSLSSWTWMFNANL